MRELPIVKALFYVAAVYDGVLGLAFMFAAPAVFELVARDPRAHRDLIGYGMLLKLSYVSIVFYHWSAGGISGIWKPFAFADLAFLVLFAWAWARVGRHAPPEPV
jgi:hypothetical protein